MQYKKMIFFLCGCLVAAALNAQLPARPAPGRAGAVQSAGWSVTNTAKNYSWWVAANQNRLQHLSQQRKPAGDGHMKNTVSYDDFQRQMLTKYPFLQEHNQKLSVHANSLQAAPPVRPYSFYQQMAAQKLQQGARTH